MNDAELKALTLADVVRLISSKKISPVELTKATLDRIDGLNEKMRIFITITVDRAIEQARKAEQEIARGHRPPLLGVPVSLKDLYDTHGIKTTAGSKVFAERIPSENATVVDKLNEVGAVVLGKTNLHEFAFGVTNINPHYGTTLNPWNPRRITGGSSGGSASAVALSLGFASCGSDTGGSIRIPSALCGVVGLKPTYGLISLHGLVPLSWSLDHAGPITRTVEDAAIVLGVMAGYDPRDPTSLDRPIPSYAAALTGDIRRIRIGVPKTYFFENLDPEVETATKNAIRTLEKLGAAVVEVDLPSARQQRDIFVKIASPEAYAYHEPFLEQRCESYGSDVRSRIEAGKTMYSVDYVRAQRARLVMKAECDAIFKTADVIVTPTVPIAAPLIEEVDKPLEHQSESPVNALTRFTRPFNLTGLPSISVPCGFTAERLPIGLQISGKAFDEATILRVAYAYEQDSRWFLQRSVI